MTTALTFCEWRAALVEHMRDVVQAADAHGDLSCAGFRECHDWVMQMRSASSYRELRELEWALREVMAMDYERHDPWHRRPDNPDPWGKSMGGPCG